MQVQYRRLTGAEFKRDPFPLLRELRENGPLVDFKIPIIGKLRLATTYCAASQVLRDRDRFVLEAKNAGIGRWGNFINWFPRPIRVLAQNMLQKDEPDHRRLRSLAELAFLRKNVESMRDDVQRLTTQLLDQFATSEGSIDLLARFARPLPLTVICELLGLPLEDRSKFTRWMNGLSNASFPAVMFTALPGIWRLNAYLRGRFEHERRQPSDGLLSELVAAEQEGSRLSEDELLAMTFILFLAGHETTTHLIALSVMTLLERDDLRCRWMQEPQNRLRFVDELLRYLSPVQMTKLRYCAEDTEIDGVPVGKGEKLMSLLAAANVDPMKFDRPEEIDFDRRMNQHLGFGGGIHFCLGAQLARMETEIGITSLLERFEDLQLAKSPSELGWTFRPGIRSLRELPLTSRAFSR